MATLPCTREESNAQHFSDKVMGKYIYIPVWAVWSWENNKRERKKERNPHLIAYHMIEPQLLNTLLSDRNIAGEVFRIYIYTLFELNFSFSSQFHKGKAHIYIYIYIYIYMQTRTPVNKIAYKCLILFPTFLIDAMGTRYFYATQDFFSLLV